MGTYCNVAVNEVEIWSYKSAVDPSIGALFREDDLVVVLSPSKEIDDPPYEVAEYRITACAMRQRLSLMGYTDAYVVESLQECAKILVREGLDAPRNFSFSRWCCGMSSILDSKLRIWEYYSTYEDIADKFVRQIAHDQHCENATMGLPFVDEATTLCAVCIASRPDHVVSLNIRDLVNGGYYERPQGVADDSMDAIAGEFSNRMNIIVLTEGRSDIDILKSSLKLLHPALFPLFSFMDFEHTKAPGSAGHLVNLVRSFAAAGIKNRVVAVFDNDTAGADAMRSLSLVKLPPTIRVMQLPSIHSLAVYPTLGPGGRRRMDINGLAGSIEMYVGTDALSFLKGKKRMRSPIQWTGYSRAIGRYQGEVIDKIEIQRRYADKVRLAKPEDLDASWDDLRAVWWAILQTLGVSARRPKNILV